MTFTEEELFEFRNGEVWKVVNSALNDKISDLKEEMFALDFSKDESKIQATKIVAKKEAIEDLQDFVKSLEVEEEE